MNVNLPIGEFRAASVAGNTIPPLDGTAIMKPTYGDGDDIQSAKELKQAQLNGKNIPIGEEQLVKAIDRAIKAMEGTSISLDFSIHEKTKHMIVRVLNKDTGQLIREIPSEKSLDFLAKVWNMAGVLMDEKR